jgi:uncharacterized protein YegL
MDGLAGMPDAVAGDGWTVLPFYLVLDVSSSMAGAGIEAINAALPGLLDEISSNLIVADKTRFCLITFASEAEVALPLCDLSEVDAMPVLHPSGLTSYARAFDLLRRTIAADVEQLKAEGIAVYRPTVFFMTDGNPNGDDWLDDHRALTAASNPYRPNVMAFGVGDVSTAILGQVATSKAYLAIDDPASALTEFATTLTRSIVRSGEAADGRVRVPVEPGPGFREVDVIDIDEI